MNTHDLWVNGVGFLFGLAAGLVAYWLCTDNDQPPPAVAPGPAEGDVLPFKPAPGHRPRGRRFPNPNDGFPVPAPGRLRVDQFDPR